MRDAVSNRHSASDHEYLPGDWPETVEHDGHIDHVHDGYLHHQHGNHVHEHGIPDEPESD